MNRAVKAAQAVLPRSRSGGGFLARSPADRGDPFALFLQWLALALLLAAAASLLGRWGIWRLLIGADPTFLTVVIILLFAGATLWCGTRAWQLARARAALNALQALLEQPPAAAAGSPDRVRFIDAARATTPHWLGGYFAMLLGKGSAWRDNAQLTDWLAEHANGPHETAWWVNGIQLKLGLLGKVIGFSVLALDLGAMESFDVSQSQALLKALTGGLGIALLTTMTGLVGNILLGLQLTRLDRFADALIADALCVAESSLAAVAAPGAAADAPAQHSDAAH